MADSASTLTLDDHDAASPENSGRGLNTIRRHTLKERIYQEVRRALLAGKFAPGEPVTVKLLEDELSAGTMPIREALQRLVAEGGFVNLPNGRVRVPVFTASEFDLIKEIRLRLEGLAAFRAASVMTDGLLLQIKNLQGVIQEEAGKGGDYAGMILANYRFHMTIYGAGGPDHLTSLIEGLWLRVSPLLIVPFRQPAGPRREFLAIRDCHQTLIDALEARDGRGAEAAIREIILRSAAWYDRHYQFDTAPAGSEGQV